MRLPRLRWYWQLFNTIKLLNVHGTGMTEPLLVLLTNPAPLRFQGLVYRTLLVRVQFQIASLLVGVIAVVTHIVKHVLVLRIPAEGCLGDTL